jgi:hypothetical protein
MSGEATPRSNELPEIHEKLILPNSNVPTQSGEQIYLF